MTFDDTSRTQSDRRLLQFRLKTLLLVPLLLGLFQTFSDQPFDHFIYLMLGYGAIFGTLWGIAAAHFLKRRQHGLRRLARFASAAALGGLISGMLAGAPALAISLWRSDPDWEWYWWHPKITWQDKAIEGATIAIGGIWLGGVLATAGGILAGVPVAYLSFWRKQQPAGSILATESNDPSAMTTAGSSHARLIRWSLIVVSAVLMIGPPAWILYGVARRHLDERSVAALRAAGLDAFASKHYFGPNWLKKILSTYGIEAWLHRVMYLSVSGVLDESAWQLLESFRDLRSLGIASVSMTDEQLKEAVRRLDRTHADDFGLRLSESPIGDAGLRHVSALTRLRYIDLRQTNVTDDGLMHLAGLPNLYSLSVSDTKVTPQGIANLRSRSRAAFRVD